MATSVTCPAVAPPMAPLVDNAPDPAVVRFGIDGRFASTSRKISGRSFTVV